MSGTAATASVTHPAEPAAASKQYLGERDLAELLGISVRTVQRMHCRGQLPKGKRVSDRVVRWSAAEIRRWFEHCPTAI